MEKEKRFQNIEKIYETPSKLGENGKNKLLESQYILLEKNNTHGKQGEVFFVLTPTYKKNTLAIKRQIIKSPNNPKDQAYRELLIFNYLSNLQCQNFINIFDWYKIRPPLSPHDYIEENKENLNNKQFMHIVMEYAEEVLAKIKTLYLSEYKSILFQILFALYKAQKELEFNHNDLHAKNILLKKLSKESFHLYETEIDGIKYKWKTIHYSVKICDFGLSRIREPITNKIIFNPKNPWLETFLPGKDIEQLSTVFSKIKIIKWDINYIEEDDDEEDILEKIHQEKRSLRDLKMRMKKGIPPIQLITHKFFYSLQQQK